MELTQSLLVVPAQVIKTTADEVSADSPVPNIDIAVTPTRGEGVVVPENFEIKNTAKG